MTACGGLCAWQGITASHCAPCDKHRGHAVPCACTFHDRREGAWLQTWSGGQFWLLDPRPGDVHTVDIVQSLSHLCRFGGHVEAGFYSVLQHSCHVHDLVEAVYDEPWLRRAALLHDTAEAYLGDMTRPLRRCLPVFERIEEGVNRAIEARYDLPHGALDDQAVRTADDVMLATEKRDLLRQTDHDWGPLQAPRAGPKLTLWSRERAVAEFGSRMTALGLA